MTPVLVLDVPWPRTRWGLLVAALDKPMRRRASLLWRSWTELRIDVDLPADDLEDELTQLYERWFASDATMDDLDGIGMSPHGLEFKARQADGEMFIYVVDPARRALAAYIVLNRLVEVNRQADKHLRSPHAKVAQAYRRLGITSAVYRWWLDAGRNLMSSERQSSHAHQMWMSLARDYQLVQVRLQDKQVHAVGAAACASVLHELGTRIVLLGRGCDVGAFAGT